MKTNFENNKLTIFLEGRIDAKNSPETEAEIFAELSKNPGASEVVIDAEKLEYISSAGLRVLLKVRKQINKPLPVLNTSNELYEIFDITGFTELLDVHKKMREISIDGCEVIGSGAFGTVYRLDPETIVKIYRPEISLEFVEQERNISQKAFLLGVPTAISYDVVKCGNSYGVVYEMLNAKTLAQIVEEDPKKIPEISRKAAELLKNLHKIVPGSEAKLPDRKQEVMKWLDDISENLTKEETEKLKNFVKNIPDRDTFLHGDYNFKNIMSKDGEIQLIDIGTAAVGHPIFDIGFCMMFFVLFPNVYDPEIIPERRRIRYLIGFDIENTREVWSVICSAYFGLSSSKETEAVTKKLMPYCFLVISFMAAFAKKYTVEFIIEKLLRRHLLPLIDTAEPLNF